MSYAVLRTYFVTPIFRQGQGLATVVPSIYVQGQCLLVFTFSVRFGSLEETSMQKLILFVVGISANGVKADGDEPAVNIIGLSVHCIFFFSCLVTHSVFSWIHILPSYSIPIFHSAESIIEFLVLGFLVGEIGHIIRCCFRLFLSLILKATFSLEKWYILCSSVLNQSITCAPDMDNRTIFIQLGSIHPFSYFTQAHASPWFLLFYGANDVLFMNYDALACSACTRHRPGSAWRGHPRLKYCPGDKPVQLIRAGLLTLTRLSRSANGTLLLYTI